MTVFSALTRVLQAHTLPGPKGADGRPGREVPFPRGGPLTALVERGVKENEKENSPVILEKVLEELGAQKECVLPIDTPQCN
jgi:hypothetical protein